MISKSELTVSLEYLSQYPTVVDEILAGYIAFIDSSKKDCVERERIKNGFNIFTSIADGYYWKELFHSYVLSLILDPNTPEIGDIQYLTEFARLLRAKNKNIAAHDFSGTVRVEQEARDESTTEGGKIDVFVYDDTHCIIIENKLNNAGDQPEQLARYLRIAKKRGKEIYAIVYIPLYYKKPPLGDYSGEYKKDVGEIKEKLVVLSAVELAEKYLDKCAMDSKKETARVYIKQYARLIKDLGGKSMTTNLDKEFIKKIFSNKESIVAEKNISAVWEQKVVLLGEMLRGAIKDELQFEDYGDESVLIGKSADGISRVLWFEQDDISVGFTTNSRNFSKKTQTKLKSILEEPKQLNKHFNAVISEECDVYQHFSINDFDGTVDDMKKILVEKYNSLAK